MRECEKLKLDYRLHQQIMASIVILQRWFRVILERRRFLRLREAVTILQVRAHYTTLRNSKPHRRSSAIRTYEYVYRFILFCFYPSETSSVVSLINLPKQVYFHSTSNCFMRPLSKERKKKGLDGLVQNVSNLIQTSCSCTSQRMKNEMIFLNIKCCFRPLHPWYSFAFHIFPIS